jgi:opacity protein-like surface antigen
MRFATTWIAAGFALALGTAPISAADWGGIKDLGGGVPVPVPVPSPVPTYDFDSDWYIGVALGGNFSQDATIKDSDPNMPVKDSSDLSMSPIFGLNFGRYITPSLRAEIAIDYSPNVQITNSGTMLYEEPVSAPNNSGGTDTMTYGIARRDMVKLDRTTGLLNLLYDIHTGTRFTPYVGGGFGFSWRRIKRNYTETSTCTQTADFSDLPLVCPVTTNPALPTTPPTLSGSGAKEQIDLAAAVQAGIGYEINEWITWDNGWQMLWEGGSISSTTPSISGDNKITYKDSVLQQFRSGIRVKFN